MTDIKQTVTFLHKVPLFVGLSNRQLEHLARRFVDRDYKAGSTIVTQGQGGEGFFIITKGSVEVIRERPDGSKAVIDNLAAGDFFGEMALLDEGPRTASVVTKEDTHCLVLTRWDFLGTLKEDADMSVEVLKELARRFRAVLEAI